MERQKIKQLDGTVDNTNPWKINGLITPGRSTTAIPRGALGQDSETHSPAFVSRSALDKKMEMSRCCF